MTDIDRLVHALADEAKPVRPAPHPFLLSLKWIAAAVIYLATALFVSRPRPDLAQVLHHFWFVAELVSLLLVFFATVFSAALLTFPDLHQMRRAAYAPLWAFTLFLSVILLAWHVDTPPAPLPVHSIECTLSIALLSVLPTIGIFYAMRKFASTHPRLAGSNAVLSAFSVSALWLRLHEMNDSIVHVIDWHYLPMIAAGLLGLLVGKALLRW